MAIHGGSLYASFIDPTQGFDAYPGATISAFDLTTLVETKKIQSPYFVDDFVFIDP